MVIYNTVDPQLYPDLGYLDYPARGLNVCTPGLLQVLQLTGLFTYLARFTTLLNKGVWGLYTVATYYSFQNLIVLSRAYNYNKHKLLGKDNTSICHVY